MGLVAVGKTQGLPRCRKVRRFSMGLSSWLHLEAVVHCYGNESGRKAARLQVLQVFLSKSLLPRLFNWQWQQAESSLLKVWQYHNLQSPITHEGERNILKLGTCGKPNFHEEAWKRSLSNWQCQKKLPSLDASTDLIVKKASFPERPRIPLRKGAKKVLF